MPRTRRVQVELPGSHRRPPAGARPMRRVHPDRLLEVSVHLRRQAVPSSLLSHGAVARHRGLTHEHLHARYGAHPTDIRTVRAFAAAHGLEVGTVHEGHRRIVLRGSAAAMMAAFGVDLVHFHHETGRYHGHEGPLRVPPEVARSAEAVLGLDGRAAARPHLRYFAKRRGPRVPDLAHYTAREVARAYDFPEGLDGRGQCIGIVELGGGFRHRDLAVYCRRLGLAMPDISVVRVNGARNHPSGHPMGVDAEVLLDLEIAATVAPGARLVLYFAHCTDRGFVDAVKAAVHDRVNRPSVISVSWGSPEPDWSPQAMRAMSTVLHDAALVGTTVCVSSGDLGAPAGEHGSIAVEFPASSPYVLACGGTRLFAHGHRIRREVVWNDLDEHFGASGGGVSVVFRRPSYQTQACAVRSAGGHLGRGVPDVAGNADPETGYRVRVNGRWLRLGGTSAVAPLWAGLIARFNQRLARPTFLTPYLYRLRGASSFGQITEGTNGGYAAARGWNPCTGLGTPRGGALLKALDRLIR